MAKFMTTKEASEKWDISERRINVLCKEGRILGAHKENKRWSIPVDAVKPADKRLKGDASSSLSEKKVASKSGKKLPLPIGISDYELGQALPKDFRGSLPTIEEIEKELESH